jgi:Holliday junction resolvase
MPHKNYVCGRSFEYRCANKLRKEGWTWVFRCAGSHGVADLIAVRMSYGLVPEIRFIQCKYGSATLSKEEKEKIAEFPYPIEVMHNGK